MAQARWVRPDYEPLWFWIEEREHIRQAKQAGRPRPWTAHPILHKYRFCNVRREDDRVTMWIAEHIRKRFHNHPMLWFMLCIARQINWPETLEELIEGGNWPDQEGFHPMDLATGLRTRKRHGKKVFTGAYVISAPAEKGSNKADYIGQVVLGELWSRREMFRKYLRAEPTMRGMHELIMRSPGWGPFMAYQAIVDMRWTNVLGSDPDDAYVWAAAGPGTIRGLNRLHGRPLKFALPQDQALKEMLVIYKIVKKETGVDLDLSDVPNALCETDKYLRAKNGEGKPRTLYVPGRGY